VVEKSERPPDFSGGLGGLVCVSADQLCASRGRWWMVQNTFLPRWVDVVHVAVKVAV